ncbi:MAG: flagellar basal body L-ring protein FlgH [Porticoccaceae bacterium]|nr:MAG: flagellar basal body L-ring protein FlgH [Porticoccaceae bacterium]
MKQVLRFSIILAALMFLAGCNTLPKESDPDYAPIEFAPEPVDPNAIPSGSIYQTSRNLSLFEDVKARQVGDIVTVVLAEATNAAKSSDTSLDKSNSNLITNPLFAAGADGIGTDLDLGFDLSSTSAFEGESESNQSNSLQGSIAVTVARVLPGGNLYIQGEKWIHINQGNEYIRLRGIIRPEDIGTNNTILSTKIADARISYGGTGAPAEVNMVGWLSRFFMSPLWPF